MTPLEKAAVVTRHHLNARWELLSTLNNDDLWDEIVTVARARHVLGSYEYGDTNLFEWSDGKVRAERIEELADWLVYTVWLMERGDAQTRS